MQGKSRKRVRVAVLAVLLTTLGMIGIGAIAASQADATTTPASVTATTLVQNRPDNGHGTPAIWAWDGFNRTVTVTDTDKAAPAGTKVGTTDVSGYEVYSATISDKGGFTTVGGAGTPNQSITPGSKIVNNGVRGSIEGTYSLTVYAPSTDALTGIIPSAENDNFATPAVSTTNWPTLAFADPTKSVVQGGAYEWDYATFCGEKWVDSSANGDGNLPSDGNITGKTCYVPKPYPYGGHAEFVANTRENVYFSLGGVTTPTWFHFVIVGPGPIDGHQGWVLAQPGENVGVYTGLSYHHGYASFYTPVAARGSVVPIGHGGYVYFVSGVQQ